MVASRLLAVVDNNEVDQRWSMMSMITNSDDSGGVGQLLVNNGGGH